MVVVMGLVGGVAIIAEEERGWVYLNIPSSVLAKRK